MKIFIYFILLFQYVYAIDGGNTSLYQDTFEYNKYSYTQAKNQNIFNIAYIAKHSTLANHFTIYTTPIKDIYFFNNNEYLINSWTDKYTNRCVDLFNKVDLRILLEKYCLQYGTTLEEQKSMLYLLMQYYNKKNLYYNGGLTIDEFYGVSFYKGRFYLHEIDRGDTLPVSDSDNVMQPNISQDGIEIKFAPNYDLKDRLNTSYKFKVEQILNTENRKRFWDERPSTLSLIFAEYANENIFDLIFNEYTKVIAQSMFKNKLYKQAFLLNSFTLDNNDVNKALELFNNSKELTKLQYFNLTISLSNYYKTTDSILSKEYLSKAYKNLKEYIEFNNGSITPLIFAMFEYNNENDSISISDTQRYDYDSLQPLLSSVDKSCLNAEKAYYTKHPALKVWADSVAKEKCNILYYKNNMDND